jgi:O-antigen/teichoic acid export membrane protein
MATLSILLMTAVGIAFGVAIGLLAPWLVDLLFGLPEYQPAVAVLRIMALIIPLIVLNAALVSQWLVPHGLDRALLLVVISGTVLNLILALIFAGRFGGIGMAWITVTVEAYILIGLLWALHRHGLRPIAPQLLPGLLRELATQVARRS